MKRVKKLKLDRVIAGIDGICGNLTAWDADGKPIEWAPGVRELKTAERPWLDNQVAISSIPAGRYNLIQRAHGSFYNKYRRDYGHEFVLQIAEVPGRTHILCHIGNFPVKDSEGCILIGSSFIEKGVGQSVAAYKKFYSVVENMAPGCEMIISDAYRQEFCR